MTFRADWYRRLENDNNPEIRAPYYVATLRGGLRARIDMDCTWSGDCRRAKCAGWHLLVGNIAILFPRERDDKGGRRALALAKRTAERCVWNGKEDE